MNILYPHNRPFGFIHRKLIKGVTKSPLGNYYIIDEIYNYLLIDSETFNNLLSDGIPYIETVRKGV